MSTSEPERVVAAPRQSRGLWAAAYAMQVLALIWVVLWWADVLVVLGSTVLPVWVAAPALLVAGSVARLGLRAFRMPHPELGGWWWRALPNVAAGAWVLVPLTSVFAGVGNPTYVVAEPAGSEGCRAVVAESAFLFAGSGSVHVAGGWGPFAPQVGSFSTDDGLRPASTGLYTVSWDDQYGGLLHVGGVLPGSSDGEGGSFEFDC